MRACSASHQRVHPEAQRQVEHQRAVFDQQVVVAGLAVDHRRAASPVPEVAERTGAVARATACRPAPVAAAGIATAVERSPSPRLRRRAGAPRRATRRRSARVRPALSWPIFQSSAVDDGRGADEAAEARPVGTQDDRHVAGEVDRADGVGVVVDVRRVQPASPPSGRAQRGLGPDQTHAGAAGVVVHPPSVA